MVRGIVTLLTLTGLALGQAMVQHAAAAAGGAAAAAGSKKVADGLEKILGSASGAAATAAGQEKPKQITTTTPPVPPAGKRAKHSPFEPQVNRAGGSALAPVVGANAGRQSIPSPAEVEASSGGGLAGNAWMPRRGPHVTSAPVPAFTPFVTNDAPAAASRGARRPVEALMSAPPPVLRQQTAPAMAAMPMLVATPVVAPPPPPAVATVEKLASIQPGASYETILASLGMPASKIEMMEDGKVLENLRIESNGSKIGTIRLVNGVVTSVEPVAQ